MIHIDDKVIGRHIQAGRIQKQMTQLELANKLDVSESYVSRIECGRNRVNIERLLEICMILDLPVENILQECSDYCVPKQGVPEDPPETKQPSRCIALQQEGCSFHPFTGSGSVDSAYASTMWISLPL